MINNDDEYAFPIKEPMTIDTFGMTLRDYFAAKAMQSIIRDPYFSEKADLMGYEEFSAEIASCAYDVADAMLERRKS